MMCQIMLAICDLLKPSPRDAGFRSEGHYTWDGSIIKEGSTYHLFASRWPKAAGFPDGYRARSEIVRATAKDPIGPYTFQETVLAGRGGHHWDGQMCHNPKILVAGGTFVLYYIGSAPGSRLRKIGYAWSDSIEGPWNRLPGCVPLTKDANNPAPIVQEDGSVLVAFRDEKLRVHIAGAPRFDGNYRIIAKDVFHGKRVEDPDIIEVDGTYHLVAEDNQGWFTGTGRHGAHFTSADGFSWRVADPAKAYTHEIRWDDGTATTCDRRERPELFNADASAKGHGAPTHLVTAVKIGDETWCHVQRLSVGY
jgi:hypothetical protein